MSDGARISPTAHYTGQVWVRHGLSHPELATAEGRLLFEALRPAMAASSVLGGYGLEPYLLARHQAIDVLLERAIERHGISQVLEVACGLSPRGWRFHRRYGDRITYVEADLPGMAARKRAALQRMGSLADSHRVVVLDALQIAGPQSLAALAAGLEPERGLAILTEGLLGYLPPEAVTELWQRCAGALQGFRHGRLVSDLHVGDAQPAQVRAFRVLLSAFVRGQVHLHWGTAGQARDALRAAGFSSAELHRAADLSPGTHDRSSELVHIIEASTG